MFSTLLKQGVLCALGLLAVNANAKCNADNCYRALFPCGSTAALSTATAFCATVTAGGTTATNYPTRATAACGTAPARYISACACGPTCTTTTLPCPTVTPGSLLPNGDFECGLAPWKTEVPDSSASAGVTTPGNTGTHSFEVVLSAPPATPQLGVSARVISATVPVEVGATYTLTFYTNFSDFGNGFIGVMANGSPIYTIDAGDNGAGVGFYSKNTVSYTASTSSVYFTFEFLFGTTSAGIDRIDTISLVKV
ncbi:hypothetical protein B0H66DRAFT_550069 [Apodospora peruviana]|uniref:CBM-cenC domain-containing protein n=1 Tax=Apodospora peruviana TaxID=516989 RepID=A0AAE0IJ73_9PEZI|nr:hypothetical protein B0H66DRAFT_550069 [Apodospora peruviana]